ncbi:hypothetical protein B0H13DRAFT_2686042 [Mycena leptocephala]|nr:hypothetical protein B0H13DRAFT_2686042 [Mycena leptocephala]
MVFTSFWRTKLLPLVHWLTGSEAFEGCPLGTTHLLLVCLIHSYPPSFVSPSPHFWFSSCSSSSFPSIVLSFPNSHLFPSIPPIPDSPFSPFFPPLPSPFLFSLLASSLLPHHIPYERRASPPPIATLPTHSGSPSLPPASSLDCSARVQ